MRNRFINSFNRRFLKILISSSSSHLIKRLGYPEGTKLLIIHADDLGLSSSENLASIEAITHGMVNSGSIMAPCSKYQEIADFSRSFPEVDIGIHLTLTSEWDSYKWGPVLAPNEVISLVDSNGYFFEKKKDLVKNFNSRDIEKELRAQIDLLIESGIDLTHIDSHMLIAFSDPIIQKIYIALGKEYKLPILLNKEISILNLDLRKEIFVNRLYSAQPEHYRKGLDNFYRNLLNSLKPGLNCILVHVAFNNEEMQKITQNHNNHGSHWRQKDFDFFTSKECKDLINARNIQMITWREIRDKLFR